MARCIDNSGESAEEAIVVLAGNTDEGISAEYGYIAERWGTRGRDWRMTFQRLVERGERKYDRIDIQLKDGSERTLYFDVTSFFGKLA